ncbi:hypothetical protein LINPERHAP2_LOCUS25249 [Linum perenne]
MTTLAIFLGTLWNRGLVCTEANRGSDIISLPPVQAFPRLFEPSCRSFSPRLSSSSCRRQNPWLLDEVQGIRISPFFRKIKLMLMKEISVVQ